MSRLSFKEQVLRAREDAIVASVNRLLADKGFDLMTVDEVAADVGIAKASLYKHFPSKEALAAAAMVRLMERTQAVVDQQAARQDARPIERLHERMLHDAFVEKIDASPARRGCSSATSSTSAAAVR